MGSGVGGRLKRVEVTITIAVKNHAMRLGSITQKPNASNLIEQLLSRVNCRIEIKFLMMEGMTRMLFKAKLDAAADRIE